MKRILPLIFLALAVACGQNEKQEPAPAAQDSVAVTPSSLSFSADGTQTESVSVTASGAWTSVKSASWITVNPSSGTGNATVTVSAAFNAGESRTGTVTFKVGSATKELSVAQAADAPAEEVAVVPAPAAFDGKKRSSTTYQLLVYSFADSDGDGVGDFKGIQSRLDYLDELGVTALWLSPIHPSDSYHGYDVVDYYTVNPQYGTEQDFQNLVDAAHSKGIEIYLDYVLNHSGKGHPWFTEALSNPSSPYRDYYFFSANPSADYKNFPMLKGTNYVSKEWKAATSGSPKLTVTATDEAVTSGNSAWNLWTWKGDAAGKSIKFVDNGDGKLYLVMDVQGTVGLLVRKYDNWDSGSKFGAKAETSIPVDSPLDLVAEGQNIFFTGNGRYRIEVSDYKTESVYYMSAFGDGWMPDLNYGDIETCENNALFKDLAASADKWINMGVDGLRLDAVKHICGGIDSYNNNSNRAFLKKWYERCNSAYKAAGHSGNIFMVGEAWDSHTSVEQYYYEGITSCFEFDYGSLLSSVLNGGNASNYVSSVSGYVRDHKNRRSDAVTSFFLANHDQDRWAEWVGKSVAKEKQSAAMLLSGPGKPFVYQGEELGYYGTKGGGDEYVRSPMVWDAAAKQVAKKWNPDNKYDNNMLTGSISVETQSADENSLLNVYKTWSRLRNTYPALAEGEMSEHSSLNGKNTGAQTIAAWYMTSGDGQKLLVIHNVGGAAKSVTVSDDLSHPVALLGTATVTGKSLKLGPNSSVVFQL